MSDAFKELARRLRRLEEGIRAQNQPQLAHSSVEDGAIEHYDADGQLTAIVGKQHDDTVAPIVVTGPPPPAPTGLDVVGGQLQVTATWDGTWADGAVAPMDFARVEVHVGASQDFEPDPLPSSSTRVATIEAAGGASVTWQAEPGEVWVTIIARTLPGKVSEHRELVSVEVTGAVDPEVFEQLKTDLAASAQAILERMREIETMPVDTTRITDGSIYAPKLDARTLGALVAEILQLDVSHLIAGDAKIGDAVIAKLTAQILAAHKITADDIDAGKIAAAVAELVQVKAEQILAGTLNATIGIGTLGAIIAGDVTKAFARMAQDGFTIWNVDADGNQYLGTSLGSTTGADGLTITAADGTVTAAVTSEGNASFSDIDVDEDPSFNGRPLLGKRLDPDADDGILDDGPRGTAGFGEFRPLVSGGSIANQEATLGILTLVIDANRLFQVSMPFHYTFTPSSGKTGSAQVRLRYTYGDNPADPASGNSVLTSSSTSYNVTTPTTQSGTIMCVFNTPESIKTPSTTFKILVTAQAVDGTMSFSVPDATSWKMLVADVGQNMWSTARVAASLPGQTTQTGGSTTGTVTPKQNFVASWYGTASQMYDGGGAKASWKGSSQGLIQHGSFSNSSATNMRGAVVFNGASFDSEKKTIDAALNGAQLTKAEVFLKFPHWWNSTGGTAVLRPLNDSDLPATLASPSSSTVSKKYTARGQGYWITIPTSWISRTSRGIVIGPAPTNTVANYGYWCAPASAVGDRIRLRLTYTR